MKQLSIVLVSVLLVFSACTNTSKNQESTSECQCKTIKEMSDKNIENTKAFFRALETNDLNALVNLFADQAEHINPYASGLFPNGAKGKAEIRAYWEPVFPNFESMKFPIDEIYSMDNGNMVFVKYKGKIELKNSAGWYENDYYSTFKFNNAGEIIEYVEIFNPIVAARGFGLIDQIK